MVFVHGLGTGDRLLSGDDGMKVTNLLERKRFPHRLGDMMIVLIRDLKFPTKCLVSCSRFVKNKDGNYKKCNYII